MSRPSPAADPLSYAPAPPRVAPIDQILFYWLAAVTCVRPLISETFERVELSFLSGIMTESGTTPATTAWLDSLLLVPAVLALARGSRRWGRTAVVAAAATLALAFAVLLSVMAAGDKRLAISAGFSGLIAVFSCAALVSLMRARWMVWVLLAGTLAGGCATASKCITQRAYEFGDTLEYWEQLKAEHLKQGRDLSAPVIVNYERRLRSGESFGYLGHPNLAASCLAMWLLAAGGILASRLIQSRGLPVVRTLDDFAPLAAVAAASIAVAILAVALWSTGSTGAQLACAAGATALLVAGLAGRRIARRSGLAFVLLFGVYTTTVAATVGYGVVKGTLPHSSLAFRWQYWTASAKVFREAPLTGIGRENFGNAYMQHKSPESTEEVRNPHNLWVSAAVELGPLGFLGIATLMGVCVFGALRGLHEPEDTERRHDMPAAAWSRGIPLLVGVLGLHFLCSGMDFTSPGLFPIWAVELAGVWAVAMLLGWWMLARQTPASTDWIAAGLLAALLAALIHSLVGFSLLTPAGLSVFVALVACALTLRSAEPGAPAARRTSVRRAGVGLLLVAAHLVVVTVPTTRVQSLLRALSRMLANPQIPAQASRAMALGRRAIEADPADASAALASTRAALQLAARASTDAERLEHLREAVAFGQTALRRTPRDATPHTLLAAAHETLETVYMSLARTDDAIEAERLAAVHWQAAVELYPTNPRSRGAAGQAWFRVWQESENPADARTALGHFETALAIDALRDPHEAVRLRAAELDEIHRHLSMLREAGFVSAATDGPSTRPATRSPRP